MIYNAPVKDMLFLVNEWLGLERWTSLPGYEEVDADLVEAILEEAGKFASTELLTINQGGDEHGAVHENGEVRTPPGFREAYQQFIDNGWGILDRGSVSVTYDRISFDYDNFRNVNAGGPVGEEPPFAFDADVVQVFFSFWY